MELPLKDKVLELHKAGWRADRIAAHFTIHQHIVQLIVDNYLAEGDKKKAMKTADVVEKKEPKISKLSDK